MNRSRLVMTLVTSALIVGVCAAQKPAAKKEPVFDVKALFGKTFDGYNWTLGKQRSRMNEPKLGETRIYTGPIAKITKVFVNQKEGESVPSQIQILFKPADVKDWQTALKLVGFAPDGVGQKGGPKQFDLTGIKKTKATFQWMPTDPEYKAPILTITLPTS